MDKIAVTMRRMFSFVLRMPSSGKPGQSVGETFDSVGETFDVDVFARDAGTDDGLLRGIHPPQGATDEGATDEHAMVGHAGHQLAQRLNITQVRRMLG
ncbi:MAG: hypothetical protein ACYDDU_16025 [Dermatophilaceae bacterium]